MQSLRQQGWMPRWALVVAAAAMVALVPLGMALTTAFYCSLYFTFIDCFMFGAPRDLPLDTPAAAPPPQDPPAPTDPV